MMFPHPLFSRKLSFNTLIDLSEKCELPPHIPRAGQRTSPIRIAIIGAGIVGISTACQILDAGYECHIFEAGDETHIGGIWTQVNETSSLQIPASFYRFHPAVEWRSAYPNRGEILGQVRKLWNMYGLSSRATFNCRIDTTYKVDGQWVVNDPYNGYFHGLVAAIGTCGESYTPIIPAQNTFKGKIMHSSDLDPRAIRGKNVLIIGGGASAVEALEFACDNGAKTTKVLARSEKWFLPRAPMINGAMAAFVGDRFGILAWCLEFLLRVIFYADLWEMAPPFKGETGIFSGTPICNSRMFQLVRQGKANWLRGDIQQFTDDGILFSRRQVGVCNGGVGQVGVEQGDVCILATGFRRPTLHFLPKEIKSSKYAAPNWYLQCFPTEDATVCATNCTWKDGIASVGGGQAGVYARFLLVFLLHPGTRPTTRFMQKWVDVMAVLKAPLPGGPLSFVTYGELYVWFIVMMMVQPALWPHFWFILSGTGSVGGGPEMAGGVRKPLVAPVLGRRRWQWSEVVGNCWRSLFALFAI